MDLSRCEPHESCNPQYATCPAQPHVGVTQVSTAHHVDERNWVQQQGSWGQDAWVCAAGVGASAGLGAARGAVGAQASFGCAGLPHPAAKAGCQIVTGVVGGVIGGGAGAVAGMQGPWCSGFHAHTPNCTHKSHK